MNVIPRYLIALALAGAMLAATTGVAVACPGDGGPTCGADAPTGQDPGATSVQIGVGNPINVMTGNKYQREEDMAALPGVLGLEIVRHYNSVQSGSGAVPGLLGRGWKLSYETTLAIGARTLQVFQADGSSLIFSRDLVNPARAVAEDPARGSIAVRRTRQGGDEYVWRWTDGRELSFDHRGKLVQIKAATGEILSLLYDTRGLLVKVTDPQGRSLRLMYPERREAAGARFRGVRGIDSPVGRFDYEHGDAAGAAGKVVAAGAAQRVRIANLVRVRYPGGTEGRQYHYEDAAHPSFLTGISIAGAGPNGKPAMRRYATYGYQEDGKAILSTHANDIDKVTVRYDRPGLTTVTNAEGGRTVYRYATMADDYRLLEVRGAGCALCGPPNQRYGYDEHGRLVETALLDAQGVPQRIQKSELDRYGRPLRVSRIDYVGGKAQPAQLQVRYEYGAGGVAGPTLIARPSVVAGREAVTRIAYNDRGQPASVTVGGWSPRPEGMGAPVALSRTTRYAYRAINGRSVLAQIDGPLPNGKSNSPADSDITRFEYDAGGRHVERIVAPGGIVTEVRERDAALRAVAMRRAEGDVEQTAINRLNWRGQAEASSVEAVRRDAAQGGKQTHALRYAYDAFGNLTGVTQSGDLTTTFVYDEAGRPVERVLPDGSRIAMRPAANERKPGAPAGIEIDPFGRPVAWRDTDGAQLLQAQWGPMGTAAQGDILALSTRNAQAQRLVDDDGRVVAICNPGQGWQTALYDAAGRIEESTDPRGARQRATRDTAGRLLRIERFAPGARTAEQVLTYRYAGAWVSEEAIADADGTRTTVTERDAQGRVVRETLRIAPAGPLAATLAQTIQISQTWRHDAHGRVVGKTLTDNSGHTLELATTLDAQGLPTKIATVGLLPSWLGGRKPLIDRIAWQRLASGPYATEIAHGDGSIDRFERIDAGTAQVDDDLAAQAGTADGTQTAAPAVPAETGGDAAQDHAPLTGPGQGPDIAGLPSSVTTPQGEQRLRWNAAGQLSATQRGKGGSRYVYDARGRRVVKLVTDAQGGMQAALSVYEEHSLVAEADAQGKASFAYVHLGWRPVAQIDLRADSWWQTLQARLFGAAPRHLHTSRAGRVLTMSEGGKVVWQDAPARRDDGVHQPLRYVGQYHDADSGLDYHGARYFDARSGRFISPDPEGVADAVNELAGNLLLDLYAYAGGEPEDYFDPDGAARIRYFAITAKANGNSMGTNSQGYANARWAFIVDDIKAGFGTDALGKKRNEYAQNKTGLLVDIDGKPLDAGKSFATWSGASNIPAQFISSYGDKLIELPEFTVTMNDDDATKLIASYIPADGQALGACPDKSALLPPIKFGTGDADINVAKADANGATKQRIIPCGAGSKTDITLRRIAKYEAAAEVNETMKINRNCSAHGCPGAGYYCTATECKARNQLLFGPATVNLPVYTPSYGRSQFIGSTLVEELLLSYNLFSPDVKTQLGLTASVKTALQDADARGRKVVEWFGRIAAAGNYAAAGQSWTNLSQAEQTKFKNETGLDKEAYVDMARLKTVPIIVGGDDLTKDALQGIVTTAIMDDETVKSLLMGIFKDFDKFTIMTHALMRKNLEAALQYRPNASEEYLAAMVARAHNGGKWDRTYQQLTSSDQNKYVKRFLGNPGYTDEGDWRSLRCTESLGPSTIKPGTNGVGIGGLEFKPLKLK